MHSNEPPCQRRREFERLPVRRLPARRARAELKERLKLGSITLAEVLEQGDTDELVGKTKVLAVLESLPGVGKVKARRTMDEIGIADTRRIRGLGSQQREALLAAFS